MSHSELPNSDYFTDTKSVMDQCIRILQAMVDMCAERGWLKTTLQIQILMQSIIQARWFDDPAILQLPHINANNANFFSNWTNLPDLIEYFKSDRNSLEEDLRKEFTEYEIKEICDVIRNLPQMSLRVSLCKPEEKGDKISKENVFPAKSRPQLNVKSKEDYCLEIEFLRKNGPARRKIYAPKFPKDKNEGWFLSLGNKYTGELLALKRINLRGSRTTAQISFRAPPIIGKTKLSLYFISDCIMGLDQQFEIVLNVE